MSSLSTQANRLYPSLPNIDSDLDSHTAALQAIKDAVQTHERQDGNYLKSFVRFEELIDLGIINEAGVFVLNVDIETGESAVNLGDLNDVVLTTPGDNAILGYDTSTSKWIDQTAAQLGLSTTDHTHPPQDIGGDIDIGDLGDVDTTGTHNYDLLFRDDDGLWKPTEQLLQWDGADLHIPLGDLRFYSVGDSVSSAIRQNFPTSGDLMVQVPGGNIYLQPGVDVYIDGTSNLIIDSDQWIKWLNADDIQINLLKFAPAAGGGGTAVGHVIKKIMTGVSTTNGTYTDVTGAVITFAELEANEDYVVFVRAFVGAAGGNTPLNGVQLTKDGTLVGGSEMLYEPPWGLTVNLHGMMYYWGGVVNAGSQGDLQLQIKSGNAGVEACFADKVTLMAIKVADLGLSTNIFYDVDTSVVEIDDGSFPSAYSAMQTGVTIGDGVSDYLVFGSMQIEDYTGGSNNVDSRVSDGTNTQLGSGIGMGDFSDTNVFGFCHLWEAPAASTTLQIEARTSGWPVDKKYACLVAIRLDAFLDYQGEYLATSGPLTGSPPRDIQTLAFTAAATADYCIMGCGTGTTGAASDSPDAIIRNDLNGGGQSTLAGIFGENFTKQGSYHGPDPHWLVSTDQSWTAGDTIDADYTVESGSSGSAEWFDHFLISFAWSLPAADEFFTVGNVGYTTRLLGLTNQLNNDRAITWLNSAGTAVELAILGAAVTGDEFLANVVLLATAETSSGDGDMEFISDIGSHTLTGAVASGGTAEVSATRAKFGTVSIYAHDEAGLMEARWGTTVNSTDFDFGSGDFTLECWANFGLLNTTTYPLMAKWIYQDYAFKWEINNTPSSETMSFTWSRDGEFDNPNVSQAAWPVAEKPAVLDTWYHLAVCRSGTIIRLFVNGVECSKQGAVGTDTIFAGVQEFELLSSDSAGTGLHTTYLDDVRVTKGAARYTADFTPPTASFPTTGNITAPFTLGDPLVDMYLDANEIRIRSATVANYLAIDHDITDINIVGNNTTDINITGIAAINQAGNVNITGTLSVFDSTDTDSLAQSHDGSNFNSVFTGTGTAFWSGASGFYVFDNSLSLQHATNIPLFSIIGGVSNHSMSLSPSGVTIGQTNDTFDFAGSVTQWTFEDTIRIYNATSADYVDLKHDGTDFNITGFQTTDINITGITSLNQAGDVNITGGITSVDYVQLDLAYSDGAAEGKLQWNSEDGTLEVGMPGGNVNLQIGQEQMIRCRNTTGVTIPNGSIVYITGASGNKPLIALADASTDATADVLGFATEEILHNANGYVTLAGLVRDVNTLGMVAGDVIFLSETAGAFTTTRPTPPAIGTHVGHVIAVNETTGVIHATIFEHTTLEHEMSDVVLTGAADNDLLHRSGGLWIDTAGQFTWDGSKLSIANGTTWATDGLHLDLSNQGGFIGDNFGIKIYAGGGRYIGYWDDTGLVGKHAARTVYLVMDNSASATTPIYSFSGDNSTGIGSPGDDILSLIGLSKEIMRIDGTLAAENAQVRSGYELRVYDSTNVDNAALSHSGTDFLFALTGTEDVKFSGATVRYDFDNDVIIGAGADRIILDAGDGTIYWGGSGDAGRLSWDTNEAQVFARTGNALHLGGGERRDDLIIDTSGDIKIAGDLQVNANYVLEGYTAGRSVLRAMTFKVEPGATPGTNVNITYQAPRSYNPVSGTNDATNLAKSGTSGNWQMDAVGKLLFNPSEVVVGAIVSSINVHDINSSSTTELYTSESTVVSGYLQLGIFLRPITTNADWTTIMDAGDACWITVVFVTST